MSTELLCETLVAGGATITLHFGLHETITTLSQGCGGWNSCQSFGSALDSVALACVPLGWDPDNIMSQISY